MSKLEIGQSFTGYCDSGYSNCYCSNCSDYYWITGLMKDTVTYNYYSTSVEGSRYECSDTTTRAWFLVRWRRKGVNLRYLDKLRIDKNKKLAMFF